MEWVGVLGVQSRLFHHHFCGGLERTWTYTVPAPLQNGLVSGATYFIVTRSTDNAGNAEFGPLTGNIPTGIGVTIVYDTAAPTALYAVPAYLSLPVAKAFNQLPSVNGTATGDVGIQSVKFAVQQIGSPSLWFDGTNFTQNQGSIPYFLPVSGTSVWSSAITANLVAALSDHSQYVFVASATALSGVTQSVFPVGISSFTLTYDASAPGASITVPLNNNSAFRRSAIGRTGSLLSGIPQIRGLWPLT